MQKYEHFGREIASILIYLKTTIILLLYVRIYNIYMYYFLNAHSIYYDFCFVPIANNVNVLTQSAIYRLSTPWVPTP